METTYAAIELNSRPQGEPKPENFRLVSRPMPTPGDRQVLVRNKFLSLDPYMRGRMNEAKSYAPPVELGGTMVGGTVGRVVISNHPALTEGDIVLGALGWQEYGLANADGLVKIDESAGVPAQAYLGAAGMPGITAWFGMKHICLPNKGDTVVVSSAAGAVGGAAGQIARLLGASRVIGIAGGPEKCSYARDELGFDACIDYKAVEGELAEVLAAEAPQGVDAYFDNVGGNVLSQVLTHMNQQGRIALCGMIAGYNGEPIPIINPWPMLANRLTVRGFIITDQVALWPEARRELIHWIQQGNLRYRETIAHGLDQAPDTFIGLLKGQQLGKSLIQLHD